MEQCVAQCSAPASGLQSVGLDSRHWIQCPPCPITAEPAGAALSTICADASGWGANGLGAVQPRKHSVRPGAGGSWNHSRSSSSSVRKEGRPAAAQHMHTRSEAEAEAKGLRLRYRGPKRSEERREGLEPPLILSWAVTARPRPPDTLPRARDSRGTAARTAACCHPAPHSTAQRSRDTTSDTGQKAAVAASVHCSPLPCHC